MSKIKVNEIENRTGSTLTLGKSGTTIQLACGATQTGFGASGAVNWCSTIYTNSPGTVTAVSGKGFFLNTTSGSITINLPSSPSVGDIVAIKDYADTFDSNSVTVGRGGSKIGGACLDATLTTEGESITLIYADSTRGWLNVNTDSTVKGSAYVVATGGTESTCGDYKIHTFTSAGNFIVTASGTPSGSDKVSYMVVAGGGGGGSGYGGGGGAGGFREGKCSSDPYTDSPLDAGAGLSVPVSTYPISVGAGGAGGANPGASGTSGVNSVFSSITSAGGGGGGKNDGVVGLAGGSGGGGGAANAAGGAGNTPPVSPPQGNNGGTAGPGPAGYGGGGGGGATAVGNNGNPSPSVGGAGATTSINGTPTARAGGGGGSQYCAVPSGAAGGAGGGGTGGGSGPSISGGGAGTVNTGGGGGAGGFNPGGPTPGHQTGGAGGSGIVILRYKFQN